MNRVTVTRGDRCALLELDGLSIGVSSDCLRELASPECQSALLAIANLMDGGSSARQSLHDALDLSKNASDSASRILTGQKPPETLRNP